MTRYTVIDNRGFEIYIDADYITWDVEYDRLVFVKGEKIIAMFNTNNIIGYFETKEASYE